MSLTFFSNWLHFSESGLYNQRTGFEVFALPQREQALLLGGAVLPVHGQLLHLHLQTFNLVSEVLLEEPVGLQGRVPLSLRLSVSAFESWGGGVSDVTQRYQHRKKPKTK